MSIRTLCATGARRALALGLLVAPSLAGAATAQVIVPAGLNNPRGIAFAPNGELYVVETGNGKGVVTPDCPIGPTGGRRCYGESGAITEVRPDGSLRRLVRGLPSLGLASGQGEGGPLDISFHGMVAYVTLGWGGDPAGRAGVGAKSNLFGHVIRVLPNGRYEAIADVAGLEGTLNPVDDPDSNPFGIIALPGRQIVADAGANAIFQIDARRRVSLLAVPENLPPFPAGPSRQTVTTSVAQGPDGALYVGLLTAAPFWQGTSRILRIEPDGSAITTFATGFSAVIDVTFDAGGALYVLQVGQGLIPQPRPLPPIGPPIGPGQGKLLRLCPGSTTPETLLSGLTFPGGVAIGPDGAAWVTNLGTSAGGGQVLRLPLAPCS